MQKNVDTCKGSRSAGRRGFLHPKLFKYFCIIPLGVEGNLNRAKHAAKDGVEDVRDGQHPGDALQRVGGELHRAGEKTADRLKDGLDELKDEAKDRLNGRPG